MPRILPTPTPAQQELLTTVAAAVAQRDAADRNYVDSIIAAKAAGLTVTQIARATGTTYQAVQAVLKNSQRNTSL